jgi:hypothetical protein
MAEALCLKLVVESNKPWNVQVRGQSRRLAARP